MTFEKVEQAVRSGAKGIAWDTCHKIYVLMDDAQMDKMREYGYDPLISSDEATPDEMIATLHEWWDNSCSLRFISSVRTVDGDPNKGYEDLIAQFEDELDEEDES